MAREAKYTVAYEADNGECVDLCRIVFSGDGSYYVTAPYHPASRALAGIYEVNYAADRNLISPIDSVDLAVLDDDKRRLKISHHVNGFLQFSGEGIRSGLDKDGKPKGIGLMSYPRRFLAVVANPDRKDLQWRIGRGIRRRRTPSVATSS